MGVACSAVTISGRAGPAGPLPRLSEIHPLAAQAPGKPGPVSRVPFPWMAPGFTHYSPSPPAGLQTPLQIAPTASGAGPGFSTGSYRAAPGSQAGLVSLAHLKKHMSATIAAGMSRHLSRAWRDSWEFRGSTPARKQNGPGWARVARSVTLTTRNSLIGPRCTPGTRACSPAACWWRSAVLAALIGFRLLKGTLHHEFHSCDRAFQYAKLNNAVPPSECRRTSRSPVVQSRVYGRSSAAR